MISHTDLDRKNVIWQKNVPFIIDWEASGYINPTIELIQVAWVNYNLQRALCIECKCDKEEIELAENEIKCSIEEIIYNIGQMKQMIKLIK